jgi:CubicO group peptidase (beta-lactamase class C family)
VSVSWKRGSLSDRVNAVVARALSDQRLVGVVVLVALEDEIAYRGAAGLADREAARPVREDTLFRLSSLTKPIVSVAAMALVERGRLDLDETTTLRLPEFRPKAPDGSQAVISVRQLLTHTAGLSYGFLEPEGGAYQRAGVSDGLAEPGLSMQEELRRLGSVPLLWAPGTAWNYSLGIDVLGEILARAAHLPLPALVEQLVTGPLRMTDTAFNVRDPARLATAYVDGSPPRRMHDPEVVPFEDCAGIRFSPARVFNTSSFASGGTGMVGTAGDFLILLEALRRGGAPILSPDGARAMMTNQIGALRINVEPTPSWGFGFGGAVLMDPELAQVPQAIGAWKWGGVYGHHWYVDPRNRLTVVALTNTAVEGMTGGFVRELLNAVYGQ